MQRKPTRKRLIEEETSLTTTLEPHLTVDLVSTRTESIVHA